MAKKKKFYKKAKPKKKELPSNSRTITEKFINDHSMFLFGLAGILIAIAIVSFDLYRSFANYSDVLNERQEVVDSLNFWNKEVIDKPGYRDGYFSLALIYYQLGEVDQSSENLDKALGIDPNFERGIEFKNYLDGDF